MPPAHMTASCVQYGVWGGVEGAREVALASPVGEPCCDHNEPVHDHPQCYTQRDCVNTGRHADLAAAHVCPLLAGVSISSGSHAQRGARSRGNAVENCTLPPRPETLIGADTTTRRARARGGWSHAGKRLR